MPTRPARTSKATAATKVRQLIRQRTISDLFDSDMLVEFLKRPSKHARCTGRKARRFAGGAGDLR